VLLAFAEQVSGRGGHDREGLGVVVSANRKLLARPFSPLPKMAKGASEPRQGTPKLGVCEIVRCYGQVERDKVVTRGDVAIAASGSFLQLGAENFNCHHYGPCGLVL
jgi:hypothetical protein